MTSPWTPDLEETLRQLIESGVSASRVAAQIGFTRGAVIGKAHRLGLQLQGHATAMIGVKAEHRAIALRAGQSPHALPPRKPPPAAFAPLPGSTPRSTWDALPRNACRWPIDGGADLICAEPAAGRYCPEHARISRDGFKPARQPEESVR